MQGAGQREQEREVLTLLDGELHHRAAVEDIVDQVDDSDKGAKLHDAATCST